MLQHLDRRHLRLHLMPPQTPRPRVLFVCVHNAGRSQIAAALLEQSAAGGVDVRSAGSAPAEQLHPVVVQAMAELGIDLTARHPRLLDEQDVAASDVVITMGCGDTCPVFPGTTYLDWPVGDPAGQPLPVVRAIRDDISSRVQHLLDDLLGGAAPHRHHGAEQG